MCFANRILYMQAVKAGLYANQLDWGMSVASTQPILNTFNYALRGLGVPRRGGASCSSAG